MTSLEDAAKKFREAKLAGAGSTQSAQPSHGLEEQIDQRLQQTLTQSKDPNKTRPSKSPAKRKKRSNGQAAPELQDNSSRQAVEPSGPTQWKIPPPVVRSLGGRSRTPIEVPIHLEQLRLEATDKGMSAGHLVLAAMHAHREDFVAKANNGDYMTGNRRGFTKQWQLLWHDDERREFDALVDQTKEHMPRRSRARVATALLELCLNGNTARSADALKSG